LIPVLIPLNVGKTLSFEAEDLARLGSLGYFYFDVILERGNFYAGSQSCICKIEIELVDDLIAVACQDVMWFFLNEDQQITRRASLAPGVPFASQGQLHALFHAGGYLDLYGFLVKLGTASLTGRTFILDDLSRPLTGGAGGGGLHLTQKGTPHLTDHPISTAGTAGGDRSGISGARTVAGGTFDLFFDLDGFGDPVRNFFKCQRDLDPKIGTPGTPAAGPFLSTKERTKRTAAAKNIPELVKNIFHRTSARTSKATLTVHPGVSKPVIAGSFVRITQYLVSFCRFFEFFFCFGVSRIFIGMILHRNFPIGFFNNGAVGSFFYS